MYPDAEAGATAPQGQHITINSEFFASKQVRHGFIRKVYSLLTIQLIITVAIISIFAFTDLREWGRTNEWFYPVAFIASIGLLLVIVCAGELRRKHPINLIILFAFTVAQSLIASAITVAYDTDIIALAGAITILLTVALTIFATQVRYDFTAKFGALIIIFLVGASMILIASFFPQTMAKYRLFIAGFMAIMMGMFIVVRTQMIVGGTHSLQISPEEYVFAAITLYLDIVNMFIYILMLLGRR